MLPDGPTRTLPQVRALIDQVDDDLVQLMAGRRLLVAMAAALKQDDGVLARDPARESEVHQRAQRVGRELGLPSDSIRRLMAMLIEDACLQQQFAVDSAITHWPRPDSNQIANDATAPMLRLTMIDSTLHPTLTRCLGLLPPPARLAPLLRVVPPRWLAATLEAALRHVLSAPIRSGSLDLLLGRRIGIEVSDLDLRWVVRLDRQARLQICPAGEPAEATVKGSATDLLLLASRREDADTLFFQRRLLVTGDTELGLTARNLLDQLPWNDVPLGLRIVLHRFAGITQTARSAFHDRLQDRQRKQEVPMLR